MTESWLPQWARPQSRRNHVATFATIAGVFVLSGLMSWFGLHTSDSGWTGTFKPAKYLDVTGRNGAVASDSASCSQMGVKVSESGGNAADAAVQIASCLGSVEPQSCGIGGGAFITVRLPNSTSFVIDARETAPKNSSKHMFDADPILSKYTGLASGVPGEVMGSEELWRRAGGQIPWEELVEPVADMNEQGFPLGEAVKHAGDQFESILNQFAPGHFQQIMANSDWKWLFQTDHKLPATGSLIRRPKFAKTSRKIAWSGSAAFYHGEIPEQLSAITQSRGGVLTPDDFANYSVIVRPALEGRFNGSNLVTAPAPASGAPLVMGSHALEVSQRKRNVEDSDIWAHRTVEIMKWMAAARSELGDPDFVQNDRAYQITESEWAHAVVRNISDDHTLDSWRDYHPSYEMNNPKGTSHFSVVDADGMAVAMTTTVNLPFGNGICDPVTGVIMNSEMDDFSTPVRQNGFELAPSIYNFVAPGKRPLSSTVPTISFDDDGEVQLVIGGAGGSRIMTSVFQAISRMYGPEMPVTGLEAVTFPRFHHQLIPETLMVEPGFSPKSSKSFKDRNHDVEIRPPGTAMNLVHRGSEGLWHAVGDFYRKRGLGAAY